MISAQIIGGEKLIEKLGSMGAAVRGEVTVEVQRLALRLMSHVVADKLSGQVLNVRSGRLRRSINQRVDSDGSTVTASVGTNVEYGRAFEFGFKGPEQIRAHMRRMDTAFGKPVKNPREIMVRSHTRNVDIRERSFLRSALADMTPEIRLQLAAAVNRATAK